MLCAGSISGSSLGTTRGVVGMAAARTGTFSRPQSRIAAAVNAVSANAREAERGTPSTRNTRPSGSVY